MSKVVKQMSDALVKQEPSMLETVMRAVADPGMDPARLEHFLKIGRELQQDQAKAAYNADFAAMKLELPVIDKRGVVLNKSGKVQFKYARYDDLHEAITPLLSKFGFAASYDSEEPGPGRLTVILELSHAQGHSRQFRWTLPAQGENQYVTNLQNARAARSFGKRCVLVDALDILTRDQDSDGAPTTPAAFITDEQVADIEGILYLCNEKAPQTERHFMAWLKSEYGATMIRGLFQGAQLDTVMALLNKKRKDLGV